MQEDVYSRIKSKKCQYLGIVALSLLSPLPSTTPDIPWLQLGRTGVHMSPAHTTAPGKTAATLERGQPELLLQVPLTQLALFSVAICDVLSLFVSRYNDPPYVKMKKLEVLTEVCALDNARSVVDELGLVTGGGEGF